MKKKVRYAVVGLGHIAQVAVLPAFKRARNSELTALVSSDPTKLRKLSRRYGVARTYSYEQYEALLQSGDIDAVYIALPNRLHEQYATLAARYGIHVLCEKPLSLTRAEGERILRATRGIRFMVAYRLHFDPLNLRAIEIANSGKIGEARYFTSEFGYVLKEGNIRATPQEGGSPLHDIGVYCINAARGIFKAEPTEVFAFAVSPDAHPQRIIQTVAATLKFPGDRVASFTCSFGSAPIGNYRVIGTRGDFYVENAYEYVGERKAQLTVGEKKRVWKSKAGDQFAPELEYFSKCVLEGRDPEPDAKQGLADVTVIEALMRSIHSGKPVSLRGRMPMLTRRPTLRLATRKPAHRKPKLVKVSSASS